MSLLENPTNYNLSESKFSLGVAIFDIQTDWFVDLRDYKMLMNTKTIILSGFDS